MANSEHLSSRGKRMVPRGEPIAVQMRQAVATVALAVVAGLLPIAGLVLAEVSLIGVLADVLQNRTCNLGDEECIHRFDNAPWQLAAAGTIAIAGCLFVLLLVVFVTRRSVWRRTGPPR